MSLYSIIHLDVEQRRIAAREFHRTLRPGGVILVSFHTEDMDNAHESSRHLHEWFGEPVDLTVFFHDPVAVRADLEDAGLVVIATLERAPVAGIEYRSRRHYLLAQRPS